MHATSLAAESFVPVSQAALDGRAPAWLEAGWLNRVHANMAQPIREMVEAFIYSPSPACARTDPWTAFDRQLLASRAGLTSRTHTQRRPPTCRTLAYVARATVLVPDRYREFVAPWA